MFMSTQLLNELSLKVLVAQKWSDRDFLAPSLWNLKGFHGTSLIFPMDRNSLKAYIEIRK